MKKFIWIHMDSFEIKKGQVTWLFMEQLFLLQIFNNFSASLLCKYMFLTSLI